MLTHTLIQVILQKYRIFPEVIFYSSVRLIVLSVTSTPFKKLFLVFDARIFSKEALIKLQLHYAIYRLRFYSNSLIHIFSLSNSHNNGASIQKNRADKSHCVIVA